MKTYCISDVHAHLDNLRRFAETLEEDDRVFVLGDVIDKGDEAIKCLEYIMDDKRFKMLLGNHEYMMFQLLSSAEGSYEFKGAYEQWIIWNEGGRTLKQYLELPRYKQLEIYNFIKNLPLNIPNLKVNERTFYLVHSCPHSTLSKKMADFNYDEYEIEAYIWDRVKPSDKLEIENQIVIAGHTVVQTYEGMDVEEVRPYFKNDNIEDARYIDIDGGLAYHLPSSKLIALCLDDLSYKLY